MSHDQLIHTPPALHCGSWHCPHQLTSPPHAFLLHELAPCTQPLMMRPLMPQSMTKMTAQAQIRPLHIASLMTASLTQSASLQCLQPLRQCLVTPSTHSQVAHTGC